MAGVAEGAGVLFWTIAALNARTEILAEAGAPRAGECSTLVHSGTRTTGGQCWDWHEELAAAWHIQTVSGGTRNVAGITEYGILAKIGVNDAGVGVLFNILGHWDDAATGVPVHLVARHVLGTAGSFEEAVGILTGAPVSASTVMTVVITTSSTPLSPPVNCAGGASRRRTTGTACSRHACSATRARTAPTTSQDCSPPTVTTAPRCAATPRRAAPWAAGGRRWPPSRSTRHGDGSWCTRAVRARHGPRRGHRSPRRCCEPACVPPARRGPPAALRVASVPARAEGRAGRGARRVLVVGDEQGLVADDQPVVEASGPDRPRG